VVCQSAQIQLFLLVKTYLLHLALQKHAATGFRLQDFIVFLSAPALEVNEFILVEKKKSSVSPCGVSVTNIQL